MLAIPWLFAAAAGAQTGPPPAAAVVTNTLPAVTPAAIGAAATTDALGRVTFTNGLWFPVGEKLTYDLYWGVIPVGTAVISSEWGDEDGRKVVVLKAVARTGAVLSKIYPVNDYIESVVDPVTFLPIRYTQNLHEGRHVRDDVIIFNHRKQKAGWVSTKHPGTTNAIPIKAETRDVLCLAYMIRWKPFKAGDTQAFEVVVDNKLYNLALNVLGREITSVGDFGDVKCLKIEPQAKFGAIFVRKGKVLLWFSDDSRRLCVKMTGKVPLAKVKAILNKVEGWGDDAWPPPVTREDRRKKSGKDDDFAFGTSLPAVPEPEGTTNDAFLMGPPPPPNVGGP